MRSILALLVVALGATACGRPTAVTLHPADAPPEKLGDWGVLWADGARLRTGGGVTIYELNAPLFSDYALKLRTIWLPVGEQAGYRPSGVLEFPVGTIISKTFYYQRDEDRNDGTLRVRRIEATAAPDVSEGLSLDEHVLVETRLLVRYDAGWRALPYVWNDAQDEAVLEVAGAEREIDMVTDDGSDRFVYIVPDQNQCAGCHVPDLTSKRLQPLGPKAWQLDRPFPDAGGGNQLEHWAATGILPGLPDGALHGMIRTDQAAPLETRARAYLDANCAHCHNERGPADTSALDLRLEAPVDRGYGVCKPPVAVGRGSGNRPYDIVPGDPDRSILVYRMEQTDPAIAMPELGRGTVHEAGVTLIRDWIHSLSGNC